MDAIDTKPCEYNGIVNQTYQQYLVVHLLIVHCQITLFQRAWVYDFMLPLNMAALFCTSRFHVMCVSSLVGDISAHCWGIKRHYTAVSRCINLAQGYFINKLRKLIGTMTSSVTFQWIFGVCFTHPYMCKNAFMTSFTPNHHFYNSEFTSLLEMPLLQ